MVVDLNKVLKENKRLKSKKEEKKAKDMKKYLTQKIVSKAILKSQKTEAVVPEYDAPSVLGDENRFFKDAYKAEKRSLFFE